jgi:YVTN family beta-propeller protein
VAGELVFVANSGSGNVSLFNASTGAPVGTGVGVGISPWAVAYDPTDARVFVTDAGSRSVTVLSATNGSVLQSGIPVGGSPVSVAYDAATGDVYVANSGTDNVSVLSAASGAVLVRGVHVGDSPRGLAVDPLSGEVYVANAGSDNVSIINGRNETVQPFAIAVGKGPSAVAYDNATDSIFVVDSGANEVSVIPGSPPPGYAIRFQESNLPGGDAWSVFTAGTTHSTTSTSIEFDEPNGTYSFSVSGPAGWTSTPRSGDVSVHGGAQEVNVTFSVSTSATYSVEFESSGLSPGTLWTVDLNGSMLSANTTSIASNETNGTYPYSVSAVGWVASPSSGTAVVAGGAAAVPIVFTLKPPETFVVTFTENGLAPGISWTVVLGASQSTSVLAVVEFQEPNGTFPFTVKVQGYTPTPATGSVVVTGNSTVEAVGFVASVTGSGPPPAGIDELELGVLLGVLVVAALIAVVLLRRRRPPATGLALSGTTRIDPDEIEVLPPRPPSEPSG